MLHHKTALHISNNLAHVFFMKQLGYKIAYCPLSFEYGVIYCSSLEETEEKWQHFTPDAQCFSLEKELKPLWYLGESTENDLKQNNFVVWVSRTFEDHLMLAWVVQAFPKKHIKCAFLLQNRSTGEVPSENYPNIEISELTATQRSQYASLFRALDDESLSVEYPPYLVKGLSEYKDRNIDPETGMNRCDSEIVQRVRVSKEPISVMRIVGDLMMLDRYDRWSEYYIQDRIQYLLTHPDAGLKINSDRKLFKTPQSQT